MDEAQLYREVLEDIISICSEPGSRDDKLQAVCILISEELEGCDWVGFYIVNPANQRELILGPFVGEETEHKKIPIGRGVCGMAAMEGKTIMVDDVSTESNYLSCSPDVKSEIVVPVKKDGRVVAELDIDSKEASTFDEFHAALFGRVCEEVASLF